MKRLLIKLGYHGKSHNAKAAKLMAWMHNNGLGV